MKNASQQDHDGWVVITTCNEAPPKDHGPGRPMVYSLRGFAELVRPHQYQGEYSDKTRIDIPGQDAPALYFFDYNRGHDHIRIALQDVIDKRKMPE